MGLVETCGYEVGQGEEGGGGGALLAKAVLGFGWREVVGEAGEEESLQDLGCRPEERDGAI